MTSEIWEAFMSWLRSAKVLSAPAAVKEAFIAGWDARASRAATKDVEEEREACAKRLESLFPRSNDPGWIVKDGIARACADAIRYRGEVK